jgi:hypothetical protein
MTRLRTFFTHSRLLGLVGWLTMVWGVLEASGELQGLGKPWSIVVAIVGGTIGWLARSGLADKKRTPAGETRL